MHQTSQDKLLFILSAESFAQSLRRMRYLKEYADWQKREAEGIVKRQREITEKKSELEQTRAEKLTLLSTREKENLKLKNEEEKRKHEVQRLNTRQKELQAELRKQRKQAQALDRMIEQQIALVSPTRNIERVYQEASLFVLSSRYEGLPMVLLEAQAFGLPVVSFTCKCGPKDIVEEGVTGYLVEEGDIQGLARQMAVLMGNESLRKQMGRNAKEASFRYSEETVMKQWLDMFRCCSLKK